MDRCCYCRQEFEYEDMRPYGPDGQLTCFECAMSTPERERTAKCHFNTHIDSCGGGNIVVGLPCGPVPVIPKNTN